MNDNKKYCKNCKYHRCGSSWVDNYDDYCDHPKNEPYKVDTFFEEETRVRYCRNINNDNNCKFYEESTRAEKFYSYLFLLFIVFFFIMITYLYFKGYM